MNRYRNWCFTINNYTEEWSTLVRWIQQANVPEPITLITAALELGSAGTPHIQGYIEFNGSISMESIKRTFPVLARAHLERRLGSQQQAIVYCLKTLAIISTPSDTAIDILEDYTDITNTRENILSKDTLASDCLQQGVLLYKKDIPFKELRLKDIGKTIEIDNFIQTLNLINKYLL